MTSPRPSSDVSSGARQAPVQTPSGLTQQPFFEGHCSLTALSAWCRKATEGGECCAGLHLLSLEEQDCYMAEIEVYKVLGFCSASVFSPSTTSPRLTMRYETAKVSANDAMPCRTLLRIELVRPSAILFVPTAGLVSWGPYFSFDMLCNVLDTGVSPAQLASNWGSEPSLLCTSPWPLAL